MKLLVLFFLRVRLLPFMGISPFFYLVWFLPHTTVAFSSSSFTKTPATTSLGISYNTIGCRSLHAVSQKRQAILDGAEWASVQNQLLQLLPSSSSSSSVGTMTVVTGTILDNQKQREQRRVVGIQVPPNALKEQSLGVVPLASDCWIYDNSLAYIPDSISDQLALSTLVASLVAIHCALPREIKVGGSEDSEFMGKGRVVVVGGSEYAKFVAKGIAAMGVNVSIVSTGNPQIPDLRVESLDPAVGELQIGFCSHLGTFDSLVDTISDERGNRNPIDTVIQNDWGVVGNSESGVVSLLKSRHKCDKYISTMTTSQRIIRDDGVLFGPGRVKDHIKQIHKASAIEIIPPGRFGTTVQTLFDEAITYSWKLESSTMLRTWTLPEFWELTSWPRDSDGASDVRFGFPVIDDLDASDENDDDDVEHDPVSKDGANPFITDISSVQDLTQEVINKEKDCLLFLSAKYCRTCKTIAPAFSRLARTNQSDKTLFCRADTTGPKGKELGKILKVNSVPLFVLFKRGERFGTPLSINKLPSKRLELALQLLRSGSEWDSTALEQVKEKDENRQQR